MKNSIAITLILAGLLSGCSHKLSLSKDQEATISPEAATFIKNSSYMTVPSWIPISDKQIVEGRKNFNASEAVTEDKMIKQFNLTIDSTTIANIPVLIIKPAVVNPIYNDAIGFNIHGGGFTVGTARDRSALLVAAKLGITVYSVDYTLAPEAKYPVAINQCFDVYKELIKKFDAKKIVAVSSSAGGEIMLSMIQKISAQHLPMMKAQILFTPGSDLSGNGDSSTANDTRDLVSKAMAIRGIKDFYLGGANPKDPGVSPIYASIPADFPATVITTGTRDLMLSNSTRMFWKIQDANIESALLVQEGMWHGFHWEWEMPESIATMKSVKRFIDSQFGK